MVRRRSTVRFRKGARHSGLDLRTYPSCPVSRPGCCRDHQEEKVGPAAAARALTCCNVGAALAAIATASAEQICGRRPDKFGHGPREDPPACAAAWRQCRMRGRDRRPGALGTSRISCAFGPGGRVRLPLRPAQPVSAPWAVGKPTQGCPARAVASQTVSSHRAVRVVRGRLTLHLRSRPSAADAFEPHVPAGRRVSAVRRAPRPPELRHALDPY
jgi:hypothetical protein